MYDDFANIYLTLVMEDAVDRYDKDAVIAAFDIQDVDFKCKREVQIGLSMSEVAYTAVKPFSSDWNPNYEVMPIGQDQVSTVLLSVSNTIDPQSFYDALETQTAVSKMKMLIGATSIILLDEEDDLWSTEEPWKCRLILTTWRF